MESPKKIAFVSWHNYLDQTNGASISTRALLLALAMRGWRVMTFCGPTFDRFEPSLCQYLDRHADLSQVVRKSFNERNLKFMLSRFMDGRIRSLSFWGINQALNFKLGAFIAHSCYSAHGEARSLCSANGLFWGSNGVAYSSDVIVTASLWGWKREDQNLYTLGGRQKNCDNI